MKERLTAESEIITCSTSLKQIETANIIHEGKKYEGFGSFLTTNKDGLLVGIMYAYEKENKVGSWNGEQKFDAKYLHEYKSVFLDYHQTNQVNQVIRFKIGNKSFSAIWYNKNWCDVIRVKELKHET